MIVPSRESARPRIRDLGYAPGKFAPGPQNSILDVDGGGLYQVFIYLWTS